MCNAGDYYVNFCLMFLNWREGKNKARLNTLSMHFGELRRNVLNGALSNKTEFNTPPFLSRFLHHFPSLARQCHRAWHRPSSGAILAHRAPGKPDRFRRRRKRQAV